MSEYAYIVSDVVEGKVIAELPLSGVSYESVVSGAGGLNANLRFPSVGDSTGTALARIYKSGLDPVRCFLDVFRDDVPVWGGPIWSSGYTLSSRTAKVEGAEWWSFMRKRFVTSAQTFTAVDLHDIARALVTYTQGLGDLGIDLDSTESGETLTITYAASEVVQVSKAIETLGAQLNGFEFAIDVTIESGVVVRRLNLSHPQRGRDLDVSLLVFEHGRNLLEWTEGNDGTQMAGRVIGVGAGQAPDTLTSIQTPDDPPLGYPLVDATVSCKNVADQVLLDDLTKAEANRLRLPKRTVTARVLPDLPDLGSYRTGDEARFIIDPGMDPWYIDGLDETNRIVGIKVSPDDDGGPDAVDLTLVNRPTTDQTVQADLDRRLRALEATTVI